MGWTGSTTSNFNANPFAPGGAKYQGYRQGTEGYNGATNNSAAWGFKPMGSNWWSDNPYAAGGANFGMNPGVGMDYISAQLAQHAQAQKAREQQQAYASRAPSGGGTNPLASILSQLGGGLGGGGAGGGINYSSGITAGPVYQPGEVATAQQGIQDFGQQQAAQPLNVPGAPSGMQAAIQRQLGDSARAGSMQASTQFGRDAAFKNAQQQLSSEAARAQSGVGMANLGLQMQQQNQQPLLALMKMFGGMLG